MNIIYLTLVITLFASCSRASRSGLGTSCRIWRSASWLYWCARNLVCSIPSVCKMKNCRKIYGYNYWQEKLATVFQVGYLPLLNSFQNHSMYMGKLCKVSKTWNTERGVLYCISTNFHKKMFLRICLGQTFRFANFYFCEYSKGVAS